MYLCLPYPRLICCFLLFALQLFSADTVTDTNGLSLLQNKKSWSQLNDLERLLLKHFEASYPEQVESFFAGGEYRVLGHVLDLTNTAKRPGLLRQSLEADGLSITGGYDGKLFWYKGPETDDPILKINEDLLYLEADILGLLWSYERDGLTRMNLLGHESFEGSPSEVIELLLPNGEKMKHFISIATGKEIGRTMAIDRSDAKYMIKLVYTRDSSAAPGGLPSGYRLWIDGELYAEAILDTYRLNEGVMSWIFEKQE